MASIFLVSQAGQLNLDNNLFWTSNRIVSLHDSANGGGKVAIKRNCPIDLFKAPVRYADISESGLSINTHTWWNVYGRYHPFGGTYKYYWAAECRPMVWNKQLSNHRFSKGNDHRHGLFMNIEKDGTFPSEFDGDVSAFDELYWIPNYFPSAAVATVGTAPNALVASTRKDGQGIYGSIIAAGRVPAANSYALAGVTADESTHTYVELPEFWSNPASPQSSKGFFNIQASKTGYREYDAHVFRFSTTIGTREDEGTAAQFPWSRKYDYTDGIHRLEYFRHLVHSDIVNSSIKYEISKDHKGLVNPYAAKLTVTQASDNPPTGGEGVGFGPVPGENSTTMFTFQRDVYRGCRRGCHYNSILACIDSDRFKVKGIVVSEDANLYATGGLGGYKGCSYPNGPTLKPNGYTHTDHVKLLIRRAQDLTGGITNNELLERIDAQTARFLDDTFPIYDSAGQDSSFDYKPFYDMFTAGDWADLFD